MFPKATTLTTSLLLCMILTATGFAQTAGDSGTMTIYAPNSIEGASASLWGFYKDTGNNWINHTYGTGTVDASGYATINYTVPADYVSDLYWNPIAKYSPNRSEKTQKLDDAGGWGQFYTSNPNGQTATVNTYMYDQLNVGLNSASFRASAQGGTVFPAGGGLSEGYVYAMVPWTGTMADFSNSGGTNNYYDHGKYGLNPTDVAAAGYSIDTLQGDASATQQFQEIRLHNDDYSYSVDLFCFKNTSTDDPAGYVYWCTLNDAVEGAATYDETTGLFTANFDTPLDTETTYFISPEIYEYETLGGTINHWARGMGSTDMLLSGATVPEPATMSLLGLGGIALLRRRRNRK